MINLNYLKYFCDAANTGSIAQSAKLNFVSSSAVSQGVKWLEQWYQFELIQHGKNKFDLTEKGRDVVKASVEIFESVENFNDKMKALARPGYGVFRFSLQQSSLANSVVSKCINRFSQNYPNIELKIKAGTSSRCKELMDQGKVNYSISVDNVDFHAKKIELFRGSFVFVGSRSDKRKVLEAGFITTEDTKEVIELKSDYFKKYKKEIPVNYAISSWGVIANMALNGSGIAYIPDYYLKSMDPKTFIVRKVNIKKAQYCINFYYGHNVELTPEILSFVEDVRKSFKK